MKYQLTGFKISLVIHAAALTLIFSASRMYVMPNISSAIEIGILSDTADAIKNEFREQASHQLKRIVKRNETVKPVEQQEKPSETAVAEKPPSKLEEARAQATAPEAINAGESVSSNSVSAVFGPVFDAAYLKNPKPSYPLIARRMKLEGIVILQVLVSSEGKPEIVRLGKSSGSAVLDQAALTAVKQWSFLPARQGNNPISAWVDVPLRFRLLD